MKKTITVKIKEDGTLESESHGVSGKECLELLDKILGDIADIEEVELTHDYGDDDVVQHTTVENVKIESGEGNE